jgi:Ca-activated chloride channel family protein
MSTRAASYSLITAEDGQPIRLAMQRLWLSGEVLPAGARLSVEHVFRSEEANNVEAIYSFPLPRDAALRSFRISGENFDVHSELKPTEAAVKDYEQAIAAGSLAALARQYGDGIVNLTVGNIRPQETVTVRLEILGGVEVRDDGFRFRFPFTLAPGYHPHARMANGETELPADQFGDVILPPVRQDASGLHEVGFDLRIVSALELDEVGSPSHAVRVRRLGNQVSSVALAPESDVPDRDVIIEIRFARVTPQVLAGNGHFVVILPSSAFGENLLTPRRVVILLDRSGSMQGAPLDQAVKAIKACLSSLSEEDRFGLVAFDTTVETFQPALLQGTRENRDQAHAFLQRITARGGTELAQGFAEAVRILNGGGGDVLILTDGQVYGTEEILACARATGARLHCLGIGSASQDRFLTLLSRETGGVSRFVTARERVDLSAVDLFASIGRPVATGLKAEPSIEPEPPGCVFSGTPVVLFGEGGKEVAVTWDAGELRLPIKYNDAALGETIRLLRGSRLLTDWDNRYPSREAVASVERRQNSRVATRLRELSEEYGLASREMSLVAVVCRAGDRPGELPATRVVPVGMPQDTRFDSYFRSSAMVRGADQGLAAAPPAGGQFTRLFSARAEGSIELQMSSPAFRYRETGRRPSRPHAGSSAVPAKDELLMELAVQIEPDGGMPGSDPEARAVRTLLALFAFLSHGHTARSGAFRSHVARLITFLQALSTIPGERLQLIRDVLARIERGWVPPGDWLALAQRPERGWEVIEAAFERK